MSGGFVVCSGLRFWGKSRVGLVIVGVAMWKASHWPYYVETWRWVSGWYIAFCEGCFALCVGKFTIVWGTYLLLDVFFFRVVML